MEALSKPTKEDFVYLDPPYVPLNATSFTSYTKDGFTWEDQLKLKGVCDELTEKDVKFIQSNSNSNLVLELYKDYNIITIHAPRFINSKGNKRNKIEEVAITNYEISKQTRDWWDI
jgi:DNA adenine methylase